jgi:hypothetical protein
MFYRRSQDEQSTVTGKAVLYLSIAAVLALLVGIFYSNVSRQTRYIEVPHACDWFVYLREAKLFQQNGVIGGLDTAIRDPNTRYLIDTVKALHLGNPNWTTAVGPYCHDYKEATDRLSIISPPGTGLLLSLFPAGAQERLAFVAYSTILLLFLAAVVIRARSLLVPLAAGALGVVCFLGMYHFVHDWTIQPSVIVVLLAGYLAVRTFDAASDRQGVFWAALLGLSIGIATDIRIPSILLASGVAAGLGTLFIQGRRVQSVWSVAAFVVGLILGALLLLASNAVNAGGPLITTFGTGNTQALHIDWETFTNGLKYYLVDRSTVAAYLAIPVVALAALAVARRRLAVGGVDAALICASTSLAVSIGFFFFYAIRQWYYPFPAIVFAASVAAFLFIRSENAIPQDAPAGDRDLMSDVAPRRMFAGALLAAVIGILVSLSVPVSGDYSRPDVDFRIPDRSIIWAGITGGYFSYFLDRQAAVIVALDEASQDAVMAAVARDGVPQFVVDDPDNAALVARLRQAAALRFAGRAFRRDVFEIALPAGK